MKCLPNHCHLKLDKTSMFLKSMRTNVSTVKICKLAWGGWSAIKIQLITGRHTRDNRGNEHRRTRRLPFPVPQVLALPRHEDDIMTAMMASSSSPLLCSDTLSSLLSLSDRSTPTRAESRGARHGVRFSPARASHIQRL